MLLISIIILIMSNAVNNRRDIALLYSRLAVLILIFTFFLFYNSFYYNYIKNGLVILNGLLCLENSLLFFSLFIIFLSILILMITSVLYLKKSFIPPNPNNKTTPFFIDWKNSLFFDIMNIHYRLVEYPLIILFCIAGNIFLMFSLDIISIFLSIELQSYALYLICSIYRNSESSTQAGLTYFLLGGLSSGIILLGLGLLYVNTGTTNLDNLYIINNILDVYYYSVIYSNNSLISNVYLLNNDLFFFIFSLDTQYIFIQWSLLIMSIGFLFKIGAAPFHFWSPYVYDQVPTVTSTFIAIIPKISLLIFFFKIIFYTSSNILLLSWMNNLIFSSILCLILGSILGLIQFRIKRLYAYSTISHLGFILLALSINNLESSKAFSFYLVLYSLSNLNAFLILILMGFGLKSYILNNDNYTVIHKKDINNSPLQLIAQLKGFYRINPVLSISLVITLFSFAGIPPLAGFFAKQMILQAALNTDLFFIVLLAILCSVISAVYYLYIIKVLCFEPFSSPFNKRETEKNKGFYFSSFYSFNISLLTFIIIFFFLFEYHWLAFDKTITNFS